MASKRKTPGKPKGGKKKGVAVRSAHRAATPPKKVEPFRLEVGKTYETAGGHRAVIHAQKEVGSFSGEWILPFPNPDFDAYDIWSENGCWIPGVKREKYDLVREVKRRGK